MNSAVVAGFLPGDVVERDGRRGAVMGIKNGIYVLWLDYDEPFDGVYSEDDLVQIERPQGQAWDILRASRDDREMFRLLRESGIEPRWDDGRVDDWRASFPDGTYLSCYEPFGVSAYRVQETRQ